MPVLDFELHAWPGHDRRVIKQAVAREIARATGTARMSETRVCLRSPYAARVSVAVPRHLAGVTTVAVAASLRRLTSPE